MTGMAGIGTVIAVAVLGVVAWSRRADLLNLAQRLAPGKLDASRLPAVLTDPATDDVRAAWEVYRRLNGDTPETREAFETAIRDTIRAVISGK